MRMPGRVYLVGAGPGDPELLTLKALRALSGAQVVVYDRLVSPEILSLVDHRAELIPVGKAPKFHPVPQEEINALLIKHAFSGATTVRLKGGDPFIFGRGSEEMLALRQAGITCEIIPGITAAQGCAASTGVPLTHRGLATGLRLVTGHCREDEPLELDWKGLADRNTTLVVYMGAANIEEIARNLIQEGRLASTPVLAINNGTTPRERRFVASLETIAGAVESARLRGPVVFVIGEVVSLYQKGQVCPVLREALDAVPVYA